MRPVTEEVRRAAKELGFKVRGSLLVKEDDLLRVVQIDFLPNGRTPDSERFDLLFCLGVPGISEITPRSRKWMVCCHGHLFRLSKGDSGLPFMVTGGSADSDVIESAISLVQQVYNEFFMHYADGPALYRLVRDSALQFTEFGTELHDEYWRLHLDPWNAMGRLELAGVYAGFLGMDVEADALAAAASQFATGKNKNLAYLVPEITENIAAARHR